jgi:hypothetical protein
LKTETESSLRNVVLQNKDDGILHKDKTIDNVQKRNICNIIMLLIVLDGVRISLHLARAYHLLLYSFIPDLGKLFLEVANAVENIPALGLQSRASYTYFALRNKTRKMKVTKIDIFICYRLNFHFRKNK